MIHTDHEQGAKIALGALSPESITSAQSIDKVVTSSSTDLDFNGCAMELLPYTPWACPPRAGVNTPS